MSGGPVLDFASWMRRMEKRVLRLERRPLGAGGGEYTGPTITVSNDAPPDPAVGDVWIDT
jgi:hypothetical protein